MKLTIQSQAIGERISTGLSFFLRCSVLIDTQTDEVLQAQRSVEYFSNVYEKDEVEAIRMMQENVDIRTCELNVHADHRFIMHKKKHLCYSSN